ncbi:MAG: hypothetical protein AB1801_22585, partial [Chloroflexota bacterium]
MPTQSHSTKTKQPSQPKAKPAVVAESSGVLSGPVQQSVVPPAERSEDVIQSQAARLSDPR